MGAAAEAIEFEIDATEPIVAVMAELVDAGGWITLLPGVEVDDVPPATGGLFALFSGPRFDVPEATWLPGDRLDRPVQLGVRHAHGPKALAHLHERGHPLPAGWRRTMDHPRRGLVITAPRTADHAEVLDWLLSAAILLTTVPLLRGWLAEIHRP